MSKSSTNNVKRVEHTPGPWSINGYAYKRDDAAPSGRRVYLCGSDSDLCEGYTINAENSQVCEIRTHNRKADAHLIAAAPEMLEALELALATIERLWPSVAPFNPTQGTRDVVRAAIAKARGQ